MNEINNLSDNKITIDSWNLINEEKELKDFIDDLIINNE